MFLRVGGPVVAGVFFLIFARVLWVWGQRHRSLALRWLSMGQVGFALCAGFSAGAQLATPRAFILWSDLAIAAWILAVGAFLVAGAYGVPEAWREARRRSGLQR